MKLFKCPCCSRLLYFENVSCETCGHRLGYIPSDDVLSALDPNPDGTWRALADVGGTYRFCSNAEHDACNWLIPTRFSDTLCVACRHNRTIPDIGDRNHLASWRKIEFAKHRLFYQLLKLNLPTPVAGEAAEPLVFDFLADTAAADSAPRVMTGHDTGVVTIALAEADDAERERRRTQLGEPYRTLLGHFRHEVGHYYWDILVRDGGWLDECRSVFGDDTKNYEAALKTHYDMGVPANWQADYISSYATTHAWEDFAETWAHYLHIVDSLEMARAFGLKVDPRADHTGTLSADADVNVYGARTMRELVDTWIPIGFALNSINRCLGQSDLYPFVVSPAVVGKLDFIHRLVHAKG